jgi:uncharacterized membrane protein YdcZ (DUF606 family)
MPSSASSKRKIIKPASDTNPFALASDIGFHAFCISLITYMALFAIEDVLPRAVTAHFSLTTALIIVILCGLWTLITLPNHMTTATPWYLWIGGALAILILFMKLQTTSLISASIITIGIALIGFFTTKFLKPTNAT